MSDTLPPTVAPDIDPVLLMRVHPAAESMTEAEAAAIAQGEATAAAGAEQQASQQEPGKPPEKPEPQPISKPVNKDVPYLSQTGSVLNCTMGNWTGDPDSYAYAWQINGSVVGSVTGPTYTVTPVDVGLTATCVVTATNAGGSTAAPPSNPVVIA